MAKIQEIEKAISNLTPEELSQFRAWFEEFDAATWDTQIEEDVKSGRLDAIAGKAISDFKKGRFKKLFATLPD